MKPLKPSQLKIRASKLSTVCKTDRASDLTEKQAVDLENLLMRSTPLTPAQCKERDRLIGKRDAPPKLQQGGRTYVKELFYKHISGVSEVRSSKYTDKGNYCEKRSIGIMCDYLGLPLVAKNEWAYENEYITGTPDTVFKPLNLQCDVKNVYNAKGLDFFDKLDVEYEWQQHGYNWMMEVDHALVVKILLNPPEHILEREIIEHAKLAGIAYHNITDSFRDEIRDLFDFESKMSIDERINVYHLTTEDKHIKTIKQGVKLAREEYGNLIEQYNNRNKSEIDFVKGLMK